MSKKNLNKFVSDAIRYSGAGMLLVSWGCVMIPEYEHPNSALPDYGLEAESFKYDKGSGKTQSRPTNCQRETGGPFLTTIP